MGRNKNVQELMERMLAKDGTRGARPASSPPPPPDRSLDRERRVARIVRPAPPAAPAVPEPPPRTARPARPAPAVVVPLALTEAIADALVSRPGARSQDIAEQIGRDLDEIRAELLDLERAGIVYRTGKTRGTRWHLG
jgi:hypothetical protein